MTDNIVWSEVNNSALAQVGDGGYLFVKHDGQTWDGRNSDVWKWIILDSDMIVVEQSGSDDTFSSPADMVKTPVEMLGTFVSFLSACAEARDEESENYGIFSQAGREWAEMVSDELQMLALEIEGDLAS